MDKAHTLPMSSMSRNQLNQKLKLMVEPNYMLHTLIRLLTRELFKLDLWMQHTPYPWALITLTLILCQETNSTKSLSWWFRPKMCYVLLTPSTLKKNFKNKPWMNIKEKINNEVISDILIYHNSYYFRHIIRR